MDFEHILDDLFIQLNQCRLHPKETVNKLAQLKNSYQGNIFKGQYKTRQGPQALENLLQDLNQRQPLTKRLKWSYALHMVADEQASLLGQRGIFTSEGTNFHRTLPERVKDYAIVKGRLSQVYEFGGRTPSQIFQQLLIDDGLTSRKRRKTLLDPIYNYIGIGSSYHQSHQACTVIIFAEDIISLVAPDANGRYIRRKGMQTGKQTSVKLTNQVVLNQINGKPLIQPKTQQPTIINTNTNISNNQPSYILANQNQTAPANKFTQGQIVTYTTNQPSGQTVTYVNQHHTGNQNIRQSVTYVSLDHSNERQRNLNGIGGQTVTYANTNRNTTEPQYVAVNPLAQQNQNIPNTLSHSRSQQQQQYQYYKQQDNAVHNPTITVTNPQHEIIHTQNQDHAGQDTKVQPKKQQQSKCSIM